MFQEDHANVPEDEEVRSYHSVNTSLGSQENDSFDNDMNLRGGSSQSSGSICMNHFIAAYLVPLVRAKKKVHDVALHVLNESDDIQDAKTNLDLF